MTGELTGKVQTVSGTIDPNSLGITSVHEHICIDNRLLFDEPTELSEKEMAYEPIRLDNLYWVRNNWLSHLDTLSPADEDVATKEVMMFKAAGGGTIVDVTATGFPRVPPSLVRISKATGINIKTLQNILTKGGRLYPALEAMRSEKVLVMREGNLSAWDQLCEAKDPAVEELRRISRDDPNTVARLKAIDMILDLAGVRDSERPPLLDPANPDESQQRFIEWADRLFLKTFREYITTATFKPIS